jgi:hypothetical protein
MAQQSRDSLSQQQKTGYTVYHTQVYPLPTPSRPVSSASSLLGSGTQKRITTLPVANRNTYTSLLTAPRNRGTVSGWNVTENTIPATVPKSQSTQSYPTPEDEGVSKRFTTFANSIGKKVEAAPMVLADAVKQAVQNSNDRSALAKQNQDHYKKLSSLAQQMNYLEK